MVPFSNTYERSKDEWRFTKVHKLDHCNSTSNPSVVFLRKGVLKIFNKFTEEHPCQTVISIKLQNNSKYIIQNIIY